MSVSTPGYFHRLVAESPTEFWINNPTFAEAKAAVAAGAVSATTNPTYVSRLLKEEPDYVGGLIDAALQVTSDENQIADRIYQQAIARLQPLFLPLFRSTGGRHGYVAIQGDPRSNMDSAAIFKSAIYYRELGENIIIKVPAWPAGAMALKKLVELEIPTIATLGFSVDQAVYMAEIYRQALIRSKRRPPCYVTFIAGVLDTYLVDQSAEMGLGVSREALRNAGCEASRAAYRIYKSRGYEAVLLGGGARGPHHFTELVGGDLAITIGWSLAQQIIETRGAIESRIDAVTPPSLVEELETKLPDFRKAYRENSISPDKFHEFGPVSAFQATFLAGIDAVLKGISARRNPALSGKRGR